MILSALFTLYALSNLSFVYASCTTDSCLRALNSKSATASSSCSAFLKTTSLPTPWYASTCSAKSRYSSACSCLLTTSSSSKTTTTTTTKSSSSSSSTKSTTSSSTPTKTTTTTTTTTTSSKSCSLVSVAPSTSDVCSTNGEVTNTPYPSIGTTTSIASNFIDLCGEYCYSYPGCKAFTGCYGDCDSGVCMLLSLPISQLQLMFAGTGYSYGIYDIACFENEC